MDIFIYSDGCKLKLYAVSTTEHKRDKMFIFIFESMFCVNKKYKLWFSFTFYSLSRTELSPWIDLKINQKNCGSRNFEN